MGRNFDYSSSRPANITQYSIELSDTAVTDDYSQEILDMEKDLPDLELIAAKLIVEVDLVTLEAEKEGLSKQDADDAFANMANMNVEEL